MSLAEIGEIVRAEATTAVGDLGSKLGEEFLDGMKSILEGAPAAAREKIENLVREGFHFKKMALTSTSQEDAREYAEAAEKAQRRIKTVLLAESIVAQEQTAALISDLFGKALNALGTIAKGLVTTIVAGLAKGVTEGITGEGGGDFDVSSIFPFG